MPDSTIFCWKCGAGMQADAAFCQSCGAAIAHSAASAPVPAPPLVVQPMPVVFQPYGGFWIRVAAYLIDGFIVGVAFTPLWVVYIGRLIAVLRPLQTENGNPDAVFEALAPLIQFALLISLGSTLVFWLYDALLTSSAWQGTVGKHVLSLKVTDASGNRISFARATGRFFARVLSGYTMYIGFIMVAFTERKQGLHDMIAGTLVRKA